MSKVYEIKGTTTDITQCALCGRNDLSKTVVMVEEDGTVSHFGTDCASRAAGWTTKEIENKANDADRIAREAREFAAYQESKRYTDWLVTTTGAADVATAIKALGGFKAARQAYSAA